MDTITGVTNPTVKRMKALNDAKGRREQNAFLVEGEVMINEALKSGLVPVEALCENEGPVTEALLSAGCRVALCARHVLEAVCDTKTPQGSCASFRLPENTVPEGAVRLLALDGVQDPGNMGTILRTADASDWQGAYLSDRCADVYSPKVQRAAMGSGFRVGTARVDLPEKLMALKKQGFSVIVSALDGDPLYERKEISAGTKLVLVIGNEARGVTPEVQALADIKVKIPMRGRAESLNAAVAAGILMYEFTKDL